MLPIRGRGDLSAVLAPDRSSCSYDALNALIQRSGDQLRAVGVSSHDRVALLVPNGPEAATGFLSIASVSQCAPLNPAWTDAELTSYLTQLRPSLLIHAGPDPPAAAIRLGIQTTRMEVDASEPAGVFHLPQLPRAGGGLRTPPTIALVLLTSGTTARPKMVPLTWTNLQHSAQSVAITLQLTPADRALNLMPLFHISGLMYSVLSTLWTGGSVVCTPGLLAPKFFDWMDAFAPTWYAAVPTMHQAILRQAPRHADSTKRSRLRFVRSAAAALPLPVRRELEATFNVPVIETYGMTESAGQLASTQLPPFVHKPGSVGSADGAEIAVFCADGTPAPVNVQGEVWVRGPGLMTGYLDDVVANRESFRDGWFRTGDLGHIDADGYLFLTGRAKDIINRGGEKISPQEIEDALMLHHAVQQCVAVSLPDTQLGEDILLVVVRRDGASVDEFELRKFAALHLSDFKVPRRVAFVDRIPTGPTGKVQRVGMADRIGITANSVKPPTIASSSSDAATTAVARIMASVLDVERIDSDVEFFDAGGDSILAAQLLPRLEQEFGKQLTMVDLFQAPTARLLATKLAEKSDRLLVRPPSAREIAGTPRLSPSQVRMWLHDQLEDSIVAHTLRVFELESTSEERIREVLVEIVWRHQPLRTVIRVDNGEPRAHLRSAEPFAWQVHDWTTIPLEERDAAAREMCVREASHPFQLDTDLMMRASLHKLGHNRWWLLVVAHHVATDGWSLEVLRRELQAGIRGEPAPVLSATYSDFAHWQEHEMSGARLAALTAYWAAQLEGLPSLLELPLEFPRPSRQTYRGQVVTRILSPSLAAAASALGRSRGATLFMTLLAAWSSLLSRYAGSSDIAVGTPFASRGKVEFENLIGVFMNTLVLRTRLDGDPPFTEVLDRTRQSCLGAWDHNLPFELLLKAVPAARDASHSPYFQVFFQLRNFPRADTASPLVRDVDIDLDAALTDLTLDITETVDGLRCRLTYNRALFTERYAGAMLRHFEVMLSGAVASPETRLSRLPILDRDERAALIKRGSATRVPTASETVVELFEKQAALRHSETAVLFRDGVVTYDALNRRANRLARTLMAAGVGPDRVVVLCMERSPDWIVAMLAVAKAGGAYMPIDPQYPPALIQELIARGRATVVLADDCCRDALRDLSAPVFWTTHWPQLVAGADDSNPPLAASPSHLVHLFYTSGSTGRPKAVATEHRNLSAYVTGYHWMQCSPADTCLQFTSITFDPSAAEVWGPLTQGGRCAIYADGLNDVRHLAEWIRASRVTLGYLSASVFNTLIDEAPEVLSPLRRVLIGGEALSVGHVRRALELLPRTALINGYGPTETTIYYTGYQIPRPLDLTLAAVPIGRPLDNGCVYVVDRCGQLVPDGLPGELWLGGDTLARCYLDERELTESAFPEMILDQPARMYRTGDRARWLPSGDLDFLGRLDHQVKVRGVRIELGEIEAVLREYPGVRHAVAVATPHPHAGNTLAAFVQLQDEVAASPAELRAFLTGRLAMQMVPARIEVRSQLPLTPSGKIDRQRLKEWACAAKPGRMPGMLSTTDVESHMAAIWKDLLDIASVERDADFFDLGGDSLLAVRLAFQVERHFGVDLTLTSLVEAGTLTRMADLVRGAGRVGGREMRPDVPPALTRMLCIGAGPLFRPFAEALAPRCHFQSVPTPTAERDHISTMQEFAARLLPSIHHSSPQGPLILAGWSLAGVVAIEVASQLERSGKQIPWVVLFDTLSPVRLRHWLAASPLFRQWQLDLMKVRYHLREAFAYGPSQSFGYLVQTARDARARRHYDRLLRAAATGKTMPQADVPLDFREAFGAYSIQYSPAPLRARLLLVRPERRKTGALFAGDLGWEELGYRVDVVTVPGDHERMFRGPNATVLATRILEKICS